MNQAVLFYQRERFLYCFAIIISILLSLSMNMSRPLVNPDAICYLSSAESMGEYGIKAAMQLCGQAKWPFYSMLIYGFVTMSHLSYVIAAYILDGFFSLFSVVMFILIVKKLGGSRRVLWLAAMVILLSHQFNSVREYIIRDHGFWAFYLTSIWFLLSFYKTPSFLAALAWNMSLMCATLFRIEGAIFLLVLPYISWFYFSHPLRQRFNNFLMLNMPTLGIVLLLMLWFLLHPQKNLAELGRIPEVINQVLYGITMVVERFSQTKLALSQLILTGDSAKHAGLVLMIVMLVWYVISVMNNLSWVYALLVLYAWFFAARSFTREKTLVLLGYLGINIIVTLIFLFERLFLSKRYLIALSLVLMLWIPFALDHLIQQSKNNRYRIFLASILLGMILSSLGGIFDFGYSKKYLYDAGNWLALSVPNEATLYTNDYQLMYYSKHFDRYSLFEKFRTYEDMNTIAKGQWKQFDYLAIRINKKQKANQLLISKEISREPIKIFSNERGDQVLIYNIRLKGDKV